MTTLTDKFYTIAEAASLADRSKTVVRRWIKEGWIPDEHVLVAPGRNGAWMVSRQAFEQLLPTLLQTMSKRKGGRGHKATDAHGNIRPR